MPASSAPLAAIPTTSKPATTKRTTRLTSPLPSWATDGPRCSRRLCALFKGKEMGPPETASRRSAPDRDQGQPCRRKVRADGTRPCVDRASARRLVGLPHELQRVGGARRELQ